MQNQRLSGTFLVLLLAGCLTFVRSFTPRMVPTDIKRHFITSLRSNLVDVGDIVLAEVDDIGGSMTDPVVSFKVIGSDGPFMAGMSAKSLSSAEKLALQAGSMIKVMVTKVDGEINEKHVCTLTRSRSITRKQNL